MKTVKIILSIWIIIISVMLIINFEFAHRRIIFWSSVIIVILIDGYGLLKKMRK